MDDWGDTRQERLDLADYLGTLTIDQWNAVTNDDGWRVRDVTAHVIQGATQPTASAILGVIGSGFRYNKYYDTKARAGGSADPEVLVAQLRAAAPARRRLLGLPGAKPAAMLTETLVHHQDLRHFFHAPRTIPTLRITTALDTVKTLGFPFGVKKRIDGMRLRATDLDWQWGDGPEIRGTGEALLYAMLKRRDVLGEIDGDGVAVLRSRF
jgi:uncharacterized protein (TIGR03083 family)